MTIHPEEGIHWPTMITAVVAITAISIYQQLIMPNMPFLIRSYYPDIKNEDIGFYAGYMVSLFFLGQIPGSFLWGWCADRFGRRKSGILSTIGNFVLILLLGMSKNYYFSLVIRFLHGVADGLLGISKTMVADLCNDSNIAVGTGMIFVGGAIGGFLGPIIGGYLSDPEVVKPIVKLFPFLSATPYMVPFTVCGLFFLVLLILFLFVSEETMSQEEIDRMESTKRDMDDKLSALLLRSSEASFSSSEQLILLFNRHANYSSVFKNKDLILSVIAYGVCAFNQVSLDTIYPLTLMNNRAYGGFEMNAVEESWVATFGIVTQLATLVICPLWVKIHSYRVQLVSSMVLLGLVTFLEPLVSLYNQERPIIQFAVAFFAFALHVMVRCIAFNISIVLISNSTYKEFRGTALGLGQMAGGLCRFLGPFFIPTLFSWSTNVNRFPIHFGFSYYLMGFITLCAAALPCFLSSETDAGKGTVYDSVVHKEDKINYGSSSDLHGVNI
ncbi:zinc induced facilitator-like 2 protein [Blastocystis sp. ATCC 50177/Nand II]|uniref:Zinc induced facilitator-like 2 protein n=1 Tax=Blastocystis sp. subtype 1 (strain ATCC 50177 / NandII) TaxID=478820 RepID=A0A196SHP1_BLAHN|nr:zinc induced facilitator-like 2 protein [Blastocystis sp. ATCC 50177/Nand II]